MLVNLHNGNRCFIPGKEYAIFAKWLFFSFFFSLFYKHLYIQRVAIIFMSVMMVKISHPFSAQRCQQIVLRANLVKENKLSESFFIFLVIFGGLLVSVRVTGNFFSFVVLNFVYNISTSISSNSHHNSSPVLSCHSFPQSFHNIMLPQKILIICGEIYKLQWSISYEKKIYSQVKD